jgi:hypothetical protein
MLNFFQDETEYKLQITEQLDDFKCKFNDSSGVFSGSQEKSFISHTYCFRYAELLNFYEFL